MQRNRLFLLVVFISGCSAPPVADFSTYDEHRAWDAALLFDMDCSDYKDSNTCYEKRNAALEIAKQDFTVDASYNQSDLDCLYNDDDSSGKLLDFIEKEDLQLQDIGTAMSAWAKTYRCDD